MLELVPLFRNDRKREIEEYKSRGYSFLNKQDKYLYIRKIYIQYKEKRKYKFQVQVDNKEIKYYINNNEGNIYLGIEELYNLFQSMCNEIGREIIIEIFTDYLKKKEKKDEENDDMKIEYMGVEYPIPFVERDKLELIKDKKVFIDNSSISVEYIEVFFLLFLIQDKSNYLFSNSIIKSNISYRDGIVRLILALVSLNNDNDLLKKIGWFYKADRFVLVNKEKINKRKRGSKKYYLTKKEINDII